MISNKLFVQYESKRVHMTQTYYRSTTFETEEKKKTEEQQVSR